MFKITVQASEKANSKAEIYSMTLPEMDKIFEKCEKGDKLGAGFIRGALTQPGRCDEHLEYSSLLIIDGDGGINGNKTPTIGDCHNALCALGYSHILYTTHSHTDDYHKYRGIVELSDPIESHELHTNMSQLIDELTANGCALKYAHEMDTWSQIWFLPRSDNPESYQHFSYFEGDKFETIHVAPEEVKERTRESGESKSSGEVETLDEMFENIRAGKEFHQSLRNLSFQLAKDGVSRAIILSMLRSAMESSVEAGTERWLTRMKDLERLVDGGIQRASDEEAQSFEIPTIEKEKAKYTPPPVPPGRTGRLYHQIMRDMPRPCNEFAFSMCFGSLAAICGAKWNVMSDQLSGLNLSFTVSAGTGYGKGQISKYFNELFSGGLNGKIINLSGGDGAISFLGANNYTAPKPLHKDLECGRSRIICMQEAGIMLGAKSGNADELSAYVMENFLNSGYLSYSSTRSYSSEENSLKRFRAPAPSFVLESTEESLSRSLKDMNALESGFLPRQTVFRVVEKPKINRDRNRSFTYDFDEEIVEQYKLLILEGSKVQAVTDFTPHIVKLTDAQFEEYCDISEMYETQWEDDPVSKNMASRMAHKMIKFAALATVFNNWTSGDIEIDDSCWLWAKSMIDWEMENINHNLAYMRNSNEYNFAIEHLKERLIAALNHGSTSPKQRKAKVVKRTVLIDRMNSKMDALAAERKMSTKEFVERTLRSMERMGMVRLLDGHPTCKKKNTPCVQIMESLLDE